MALIAIRYPMPTNDPIRRWGLALGAVLTEMNKAHHNELGGWGPGDHTVGWCRKVLKDFWGVEDRASFEGALRFLWSTGHRTEALAVLAELPEDGSGDSFRASLARRHRKDLEGRGLLAWDLGRFVAVVGWGSWAGYLSEPEAWRYVNPRAPTLGIIAVRSTTVRTRLLFSNSLPGPALPLSSRPAPMFPGKPIAWRPKATRFRAK